MELVNSLLMKLPLARVAFLGFAITGAVMLIANTMDYATYSSDLLKFGIGAGVLGVPRAISKVATGFTSTNLLGFVESIPVPTIVFVIFGVASIVSLALGHIVTTQFTTSIEEVGIACGVVQAAQSAEHVFTT